MKGSKCRGSFRGLETKEGKKKKLKNQQGPGVSKLPSFQTWIPSLSSQTPAGRRDELSLGGLETGGTGEDVPKYP